MMIYLVLMLVAYLIGSVCTAVILSRVFYGVDIRQYGSRNPGANNAQRVFGWKMGLSVFLLDGLKGVASVSLIHFSAAIPGTEWYEGFRIILGMTAVLGHIFPVFFGFSGGKGVATIVGILCVLHPWTALICFGVFLFFFFCTRYVSLSVLLAVTFYPIFINVLFELLLGHKETLTIQIFSIVIAAILWLTHLSNLKRLIQGKEEKFFFKKPVAPLISYKSFR
ncbi:MAG: glycerol-3-phosphate 1-O-acyltransferase PlsY [Bacteroidales bacterium]|nr:glycerol-3-phosphate 1-O-acyltransferase PlsY [Bacteroidales bacterium]